MRDFRFVLFNLFWVGGGGGGRYIVLLSFTIHMSKLTRALKSPDIRLKKNEIIFLYIQNLTVLVWNTNKLYNTKFY